MDGLMMDFVMMKPTILNVILMEVIAVDLMLKLNSVLNAFV